MLPPTVVHADCSSRPTEMAEALRNLQHAVAQSHDAIFIADSAGVITRVNPSFENMTGYTALECAGKDFSMFVAGGVQCEQYQKIWREIFQQRAFSGPLTLQTKDGCACPVEMTIASVRNRRGDNASLVGTGRAAPTGAEHGARKAAASDENIAAAVHDLENMLTVALVNLDLVNDLLLLDHPARAKVEKVKAAVRKAGGLVRGLVERQETGPDTVCSTEVRAGLKTRRRTHSRSLMEAEEDAPMAAAGTILLVEDDRMIRESTVEFLSGVGYKVFAASTAEDALDCLRKQAGAVDLVVSDLLLPKMSGTELADAIRSEYPKTKVLFISGHPAPWAIGRPFSEESFVAKPFSFPALHTKIREMLAHPGTALVAGRAQ